MERRPRATFSPGELSSVGTHYWPTEEEAWSLPRYLRASTLPIVHVHLAAVRLGTCALDHLHTRRERMNCSKNATVESSSPRRRMRHLACSSHAQSLRRTACWNTPSSIPSIDDKEFSENWKSMPAHSSVSSAAHPLALTSIPTTMPPAKR